MKENVGTGDRIVRSIVGPALMVIGYTRLDGRSRDIGGLTTIVAGVALIESAITRVCPLNALFGIDTRSEELVEQDLRETISYHGERAIEPEQMGYGAGA